MAYTRVRTQIPFTKMQGIGNDFVVIDDLVRPRAQAIELTPPMAQAICDRRFGIGADQILWLKKPRDASADARMEILNSDGSIAEMCGNGIRAVALYLDRYGSARKAEYRVETLAGMKLLRIEGDQVTVDMGPPRVLSGFSSGGEAIEAGGRRYRFYEVSMGNPHAIIFVDDARAVPLAQEGPPLETHGRFPKRTNVEFVEVVNEHSVIARIWERGAGATLACGTGACASAVAAIAAGKAKSPVKVALPGGVLTISWAGGDASVLMEGPASEVFRGEIELESSL